MASRLENLNPYLIVYYSGSIKLNPDSDTWTDTKFVDANVIMNTEEYDLAVRELGIDTQTGLGEEQWGSWQTDWVWSTSRKFIHKNFCTEFRKYESRNIYQTFRKVPRR